MTQAELFELMKQFEAGTLTRLEYEGEEGRVLLEKGLPQPPVAAAAPAVPAAPVSTPPAAEAPLAPAPGSTIRTPLVGTFYAAPEPGKPPFVQPGDRVKKGQTVCIIEAMKMINEVPAPRDCVILEVLLEDGELAGFDQPLFAIGEC